MNLESRSQVIETVLGVLLLGAILLACALVFAPFVGATLWAVILAVSIWPYYARMSDRMGGRRGLAAFCVSLALFLVLFVPLTAAVISASEEVPRAIRFLESVREDGVPPPPIAVASFPVVGHWLYGAWLDAAAQSTALVEKFGPQIEQATKWMLSTGGGIGLAMLEFALAIVIAGILLANAETAAGWTRAIVGRIAGEHGQSLLVVAENTMRAVTKGVIGTALAQGVLATIGYLIVGLPGSLFLGLLSFLLAMMQISPAPIWIPAAIWLAATGDTGWAIFLAVWGVFPVNTIDNFIRPYLIGKGTSLPVLLIFAGVLGGMLAWGFIGIFLGATLLAVAYELTREWISDRTPGSESVSADD